MTLSSKGNKQLRLGSATDNQVKQCSEEKVDHRRFVSQDKAWPFEKIVAWWGPHLDLSANKTISVSLRLVTVVTAAGRPQA